MNTTDKDREEARKILGNLTITVSASIGPFGKTKTIDFPQTDKTVESTAKIIASIRAEAAKEAVRNERERILNAVNILITAWSVDHKDWREFDVGYTSALEQVAGMIRKDLTPESAPEPRTCETCDQVFDWIKKNTGWSICDPDTGDVDRNGETYRQLFDIVNRKPRSPYSADVEMVRSKVREAFDLGVRHGKWLATYTGPLGVLHRVDDIDGQLDRIAGKED